MFKYIDDFKTQIHKEQEWIIHLWGMHKTPFITLQKSPNQHRTFGPTHFVMGDDKHQS